MRDESVSFSGFIKIQHWLGAIIVMALLSMGFFMESLERGPLKIDLLWWHKSLGTTLFFLVLLRIVWRFTHKALSHNPDHQPWERILSKIVQGLLYVGMISMPVSGFIMAAAGDFAVPFFHFFNMPDLIPGKNKELMHLMKEMHEVGAFCLYAAVGLHGLGALKHHFLDKDDTLFRMVPRKRRGAWALVPTVFFVVMMSLILFFMVSEGEDGAVEKGVRSIEKAGVQAPAFSDMTEISSDVQAWTILPAQSYIRFKAQAQGEEFEGQFMQFDGAIFFDPDKLPESRADIRVYVASVDTQSDERDQYIVMPDWMDSESFPESRFVSTKIEKVNENQYVADGTLTIRGVSLPVAVPFSLDLVRDENGKETAMMQGTFTFNRLDYGIGAGAWSDTKTVANPLEISVSLKAYAS